MNGNIVESKEIEKHSHVKNIYNSVNLNKNIEGQVFMQFDNEELIKQFQDKVLEQSMKKQMVNADDITNNDIKIELEDKTKEQKDGNLKIEL